MPEMEAKGANAAESDSPGVYVMPPLVYFLCLVGGGTLELLFPSHIGWIPAAIRITIGIVTGLAGFLFMMHAHATFQRHGATLQTDRSTNAFVVEGPYRYSRNPIYVGASGLLLGIAISVGSICFWLQ